jgi:hypothetical protein
MIFALSIGIAGCGAPRKRALAPVPGCSNAQVYVGPGCYKENMPDGSIEVRCPKMTTRYHCEGQK